MYEICRGTQEDMDDILDFANFVFSQDSSPHDFRDFLPKIYGEKTSKPEIHYLLKEKNKIKAMMCLDEMEYRIGDDIWKGGDIGSVSVHPYAQGKGYMKILMNEILKDLETKNFDVCGLGGQRQRYEYFGFTPSGISVQYTFNKTNSRHHFSDVVNDNISFHVVKEEEKDLIKQCHAIYEKARYGAIRSLENFFVICQSWKSNMVVVQSKGDIVGYFLLSSGNDSIQEWFVPKEYQKAVLQNLLTHFKTKKVSFLANYYDKDLNDILSEIAESCSIMSNRCFRVCNYKKVLKSLLTQKKAHQKIEVGLLCLKIGEKTYRIEVSQDNISMEETDEEPSLILEPMEANRLLMSGGSLVLSKFVELPNNVKSWFPLPLFYRSADCC